MGNRASVQAPGTSKAGKEAAAAQCEGGAAAVTDAPSGAIAAAAAAAPDEGFQWRAKRTSLVVDGCGSPRRASTAGAEDDYLDDAFEADDDYEDDFEVFEGDGATVSRPFAATLSDAGATTEFARRASLDSSKYKSRWKGLQTMTKATAALVDAAAAADSFRERAAAIKAGTIPRSVAFAEKVSLRFFERTDASLAKDLHYSEDEIDAMYKDTCAETQRGDPIGGYDTEDRPEEADSTDDADDDGSDSDDSDAPPRIAGADAGGAARPEPAPPHKAADSFRGAGSPTISTLT